MTAACKDCVAELGADAYASPGRPRRRANHPGPRCMSHHRQQINRQKELAWARRILKEYGLTAEDYWRIYEHQGRRCALCQRATGAVKKLAVDHDHRTGYVRGLCCGPCNHDVLGHSRDDVMFFRRGEQYLRNPPAHQLGIWARKEGDG